MLPPSRRTQRVLGAALGPCLLAALVAVAPSAQAPAAAVTVPDRVRVAHTSGAHGVAAWRAPGTSRGLRRAGVDWVYNWNVAPSFKVPRTTRFVPMIWGAVSVTPDKLATAAAYGPHLLAFNEPDRADQANLSVEAALTLWPALEATGLKLGSPAVAAGATDPYGWLAQFMLGAELLGLRVDFVAVHWYGGDFRPGPATRQLRDFLLAVHRMYGKPVWLTEYALVDFTHGISLPRPRTQARFAARSVRMLDRLPWLQKYAWFALPAPAAGPSTGLRRPDGSPTATGRAYRA